jgi:CTP synthase
MVTPTEHPYFVALQAHPEFCSRPLNPSPPFLGLVAAACGGNVLDEQIAANEKSYVAPHPESAKVVPASEAVTERAKGRKQEVDGIRVREDGGADADIEEMEKVLKKVVINGGGEGKH